MLVAWRSLILVLVFVVRFVSDCALADVRFCFFLTCGSLFVVYCLLMAVRCWLRVVGCLIVGGCLCVVCCSLIVVSC